MSDPRSPQIVASFAHEMPAGILANELQSHGIEARVVGATLAGLAAEAPAEVSVVVPAEQFAAAQVIVREFEGGDVDWSQVDVGEPLN
ncbi:MAG: DUF2007 domain-containing protein [Pirellulaceae bacterium]